VRADTGFEIPFAIDFQRLSAQCCGGGRLLSGCQWYYKKPFGRTCKASKKRFVVTLWGDDSLPNRPVGRGHFRYRSQRS